MQLELELPSARPHTLLIAPSADAAWTGALADWFARVAPRAWQQERAAVVVVPTRGHAQALKTRLIASDFSTLGLQFITPPYLRALLLPVAENSPPARENLRLLLALAAEELLADTTLPENERLAAISVRRTPDHLLRLLEQLSAAGCDFNQVDLPAFRPIEQKFRRHLAAANFQLVPEIDREILARSRPAAPVLRHLLLTGFQAAHWPLWHLLHGAIAAAEDATVILQYPREAAHDLDAAWIGSWEEALGPAQPVAGDSAPAAATRETIFLAGLDTREQAAAVTAMAEHFLAEENCTRLGIVVPAAGALARLIAAALGRQGIPHYDAAGQMLPGLFQTADFRAWLALQRTPRLNVLLHFLETLPNDHVCFAQVSRRQMADALRGALGEIALDDLALLIAFTRGDHPRGELISAALDAIHFLPERGTLAEFLRLTGEAFAALGWTERWQEIDGRSAWSVGLGAPFSRTLYLRWLEEASASFHVTRDVIGQHPYALVQVLTPAQVEEQSWSHLILAGLNESAWPGSARGDFLPAAQIESLNQSVQKINRAATRRGDQGEGHVALRAGATLFLGAAQQRQLALAQFTSLVDSVTHGLALTASVVQEANPERISNPSEFFGHVYHAVHGQAVSQHTLRALRDLTRDWLDRTPALSPNEKTPDAPGILQTRTAYLARRDPTQAAGEYDFALRDSPREIKPLSVSDAEALLKTPALVWLERYLGVAGEEDSTFAWNATLGKWTHAWLAALASRDEEFSLLPAPGEIPPRLRAAAERKRLLVAQLCRQAGRSVPDWWQSGWENALCLAETLGRLVASIADWPWAAPEWRLEAQPIDVGAGHSLLLRGRADLLLGKSNPPPGTLQLPALWIIDYKTGNQTSLTPRSRKKGEPRAPKVRKHLLKGDNLQLALYAFAAKHLGAERVAVSLFSPAITRAEEQLQAEDFSECQPALQALARMQATGIFGMRGSLRGAYAYSASYPLATLAVDPEIIEDRWELTHPDLVQEGESWT